MFIRGTLDLAAHDSGVDLDRIAVATLNFDNGVWNDDRIRRAIDRVIDEGRAEPALEAVSASTGLPFGVPPMLQLAVALPVISDASSGRRRWRSRRRRRSSGAWALRWSAAARSTTATPCREHRW